MSRAPIRLHAPVPASAEEWIARLRSADMTAEEHAAFEAWLASDARHRADYSRCRALERLSLRLREEPEAMRRLAQRLCALPGREPATVRPPWVGRAALAAGLAIGAIAAVLAWSPPSVDGTPVATLHGEQRRLVLEDGSTIWLNTETKIAWRLGPHERRVELKQGEAFFDVSKDPARPFIVQAGASEVRVVGTQFSVRRGDDGLEVVVKEGRVNVIPNAGPLAALMPNVELTPDNRARIGTVGRGVKVAAVDAERITAWRTGSLEFDGVTLEEAVREVNRYTDKPLVIGDPDLLSQPISGRVRVGDVETIRFILRERFDIASVEQEGAIRLSRRR